jgi:hypothetical protein
MRKMNPVDVKTDFENGLLALGKFYAVTNAVLPLDSQRTFLAENSLMAAAVLWEGFISDLLVAYINRASTRFATHLQDALKTGLTDKQIKILTNYGRLSIPSHLQKAEIQELVDGNGSNITFSNFAALIDQTKSWLVPLDAGRFSSRTAREKAVVNALIAVRNQLAHRSERSHRAMNEALNIGALHLTGLKRGQKKVNSVGTYLKTIVLKQPKTRFEIFLTELQTVAGGL